MACTICGRGSCTSSFHSLEEQQEIEDMKDRVKSSIKSEILRELNSLDVYWGEDDTSYYPTDKVEEIINNILW